MDKIVGIIGFGHMGSAIIEGAIKAGILSTDNVICAEKAEIGRQKAAALGIKTTELSTEAAIQSDILIVAVKPDGLAALSSEIRTSLKSDAILVSVCAGKRLSYLEKLFGGKLVRVMPNTPATVGEGMSAICANDLVSDHELDTVADIFNSFGKVQKLPESLFDCVTAVSGSGPAYVYAFIAALVEYAEEAGMDTASAKLFAAQTVLGSAKMVLNSEKSPQELKQNICTPNGTTVEAVKVLDNRGFSDIIKDAARACERRSREISQK